MVGLAASILVGNLGYVYSRKLCLDTPCVICTL